MTEDTVRRPQRPQQARRRASTVPAGSQLVLLREFLEPVPGDLPGFALTPAVFDGASLLATMPLRDMMGTIFVPASLTPAYVQNHDPLVHMWSGPTRGARDFGFAG